MVNYHALESCVPKSQSATGSVYKCRLSTFGHGLNLFKQNLRSYPDARRYPKEHLPKKTLVQVRVSPSCFSDDSGRPSEGRTSGISTRPSARSSTMSNQARATYMYDGCQGVNFKHYKTKDGRNSSGDEITKSYDETTLEQNPIVRTTQSLTPTKKRESKWLDEEYKSNYFDKENVPVLLKCYNCGNANVQRMQVRQRCGHCKRLFDVLKARVV